MLAVDVYAVAPYQGRGGWSWYTGAAGWMYRLILESLLGMRREGASLRFAPVLPAAWRGYRLRYRFGATLYHINLVQTDGVAGGQQVSLDGERLEDCRVPLLDDGRTHEVEIHCQPCGPAQPLAWPEDSMAQGPGAHGRHDLSTGRLMAAVRKAGEWNDQVESGLPGGLAAVRGPGSRITQAQLQDARRAPCARVTNAAPE